MSLPTKGIVAISVIFCNFCLGVPTIGLSALFLLAGCPNTPVVEAAFGAPTLTPTHASWKGIRTHPNLNRIVFERTAPLHAPRSSESGTSRMAMRAETTSFAIGAPAAAAATGETNETKKSGSSSSTTTIVGRSRAGDATAFAIPELKWLFDCGAVVQDWKPRVLFLTHTHSDHVQFLFRWLGEEDRPPTIYLPEASVPYVEACRKAYDEMTECRSLAEESGGEQNTEPKKGPGAAESVLRATKPDEDLLISHGGNRFRVRTLRMTHRIPCLGYSFFRLRNGLKEEYRGLPGREIGRLKREGVEVTTVEEEPYLCFMGDTTAKVFDDYPELLKEHANSTVVVECTFLDAGSKQRAETTMHTHWDDLQPHIASNPGTMFLLTHFSLKYSTLSLRRFFRDQQVIYDNVHPMLVEREIEEQWRKAGEEGDPPRCNCRICRR